MQSRIRGPSGSDRVPLVTSRDLDVISVQDGKLLPNLEKGLNQKHLEVEVICILDAVMRFLSDFRANTDKRSSTYRRRYWFARGICDINFLYVTTTSSWLNGSFAKRVSVCLEPRGCVDVYLRHPETTARSGGGDMQRL